MPYRKKEGQVGRGRKGYALMNIEVPIPWRKKINLIAELKGVTRTALLKGILKERFRLNDE